MTIDRDPIATLIRTRRTIHQFLPECPPRELILRAIDLARWAPNHKLTEPWRFRLLGPNTVRGIVDLNAELFGLRKGPEAAASKRERWSRVPGWLAVTCVKSDDPIRAEEDYAACCCAIQNFSLYLWSAGVGVKWSTGPVTRHPEFQRLIGMDPECERFVGLIWYGYPDEIPIQRRQAVDEILSECP